MAKYESLETVSLIKDAAALRSHRLPELVHLDDSAFTVMIDFSQTPPHTISPNVSMDDALNEMKVHGVHLLLVIDDEDHICGLIASEDILGEKPIKILQERRIERAKILVKMIMTHLDEITAFTLETVEHARVGNVVRTLNDLRQSYALVIRPNGDQQMVRGLFSTSQIGKQLHMNISSSIATAESISELNKRT